MTVNCYSLAARALYGIGHAISKVQEMQPEGGRWFDFWFKRYVWCMQASHRLDPAAWNSVSTGNGDVK